MERRQIAGVGDKIKCRMPLLIRYNGIIKNIPTIKNGVYKFNGALNKI